jgi:hypothetical protein
MMVWLIKAETGFISALKKSVNAATNAGVIGRIGIAYTALEYAGRHLQAGVSFVYCAECGLRLYTPLRRVMNQRETRAFLCHSAFAGIS